MARPARRLWPAYCAGSRPMRATARFTMRPTESRCKTLILTRPLRSISRKTGPQSSVLAASQVLQARTGHVSGFEPWVWRFPSLPFLVYLRAAELDDQQLPDRLATFELPRWQNDAAFAQLLKTFAAFFPSTCRPTCASRRSGNAFFY